MKIGPHRDDGTARRKQFRSAPDFLDETRECVTSTNDDLHPPVLRLAHTGAGWYPQGCIAKALDGDRVVRHAILDQFRGYGLGTTDRQALVVLRRAGGIGVAGNLDPRVLDACRIIGGFLDDLAGAVCQGCLVPVEEHKIRARRRRGGSRCRSRWRWRWRLVKIVAQTNHHRMIEIIAELCRAECDWRARRG